MDFSKFNFDLLKQKFPGYIGRIREYPEIIRVSKNK